MRQFRCRSGRWIQEQAVAARRIPFSLGCRCWHGETTWPMSARVRAPRTTGPFSQRYHDPRERLRGAVPRSGSASLAKQLNRRPDRLALQYKTPPEGHKGHVPRRTPSDPTRADPLSNSTQQPSQPAPGRDSSCPARTTARRPAATAVKRTATTPEPRTPRGPNFWLGPRGFPWR